jgi:hypothetical protein
MPLLPKENQETPRRVQLPASSSRSQRSYAHCKLISAIHSPNAGNACFDGKVFPPGAVIEARELPEHAVLVECVGPVKPGSGHKRYPVLWILWKYDWQREEWQELCRTMAVSWEWASLFRAPALAALYPRPKLYDLKERGAAVAGELVEQIRTRLESEPEPVQANVLASLYDRLAGRIAEIGARAVSRLPERKPVQRQTRVAIRSRAR